MTNTAIAPTNDFTTDQIELIKRTICAGSTDDEFKLFVATAKRLGLDPFARQIFAVKRGGTMSIQVSIDGLRLVADRTGCYAPGSRTEYDINADGTLRSATAYVKKLAARVWHEVGETSYLSEYSSSSNPLWRSMPRVMLAKASEARALRRAFPAELSGVYAPEEMDQANNERARPEPIHAETIDVEVVSGDKLDLLAHVMAAENEFMLAALLPKLSALPHGPWRDELRIAYKTKTEQLKRLRGQVIETPTVDVVA